MQRIMNNDCWTFFQENGQPSHQQIIEDILNDFDDRDKDILIKIEKMVKEYLKSSVTGTQLRNLYNLVNEKKQPEELNKLRPLFMYVAARQNNDSARNFIRFIRELIVAANTEPRMNNLKKIMEVFVSNHKYYNNR